MKPFLAKLTKGLMLVPLMVLGFSFVTPSVVLAQAGTCEDNDISQGIAGGAECAAPNNAPNQPLFGEGGIFITVTSILIFIVGAIAVIMLIVGGIRYVLSQGDQGAVTAAKNTILYSIIGIVVAALAYGAVAFIAAQLGQA